MNISSLTRHFDRIGAELKVEVLREGTQFFTESPFTLDVRETRKGDFYELRVFPGNYTDMRFDVLQVLPEKRHLLLMARYHNLSDRPLRDKFLCGFDERHWFAAAVDGSSTNVRTAMEALKPDRVIASQLRHKVSRAKWNERHNAGFRRQGEWFFLPVPDFRPACPEAICRKEPIRRGFGKAHIVEELYRTPGETRYVNRHFPNGLTAENRRRLLNQNPKARGWAWEVMTVATGVYARGTVRHPDHYTLRLHGWHRVEVNDEVSSRNLVFLD